MRTAFRGNLFVIVRRCSLLWRLAENTFSLCSDLRRLLERPFAQSGRKKEFRRRRFARTRTATGLP
jgi:hypothetical protein